MAGNPNEETASDAVFDKEFLIEDNEFLRIHYPCFSDDSNGMHSDQPGPLTSSLELDKRLKKVEWVNKWLKQEHQQQMKIIASLKNENKLLTEQNAQLKESTSKLSNELSECKINAQKSQKQLSICFQENCSQKQELALLRIENQKLSQQSNSLKEKNSLLQKHLQSKHHVKGSQVAASESGDSTLGRNSEESQSLPDYLKVLGTSVPLRKLDRLRSLEKSHSSPQFFPNQVDEISHKLLKQLAQEKEELEQQYSQVAEVQRLSNNSTTKLSGANSLDISGLNLDNDDEDTLLTFADHCIKEMTTLKQDTTFISFTLKYLMHVMVKHHHKRKDDITAIEVIRKGVSGIQLQKKNSRIQQIYNEDSGVYYKDSPSDDVFALENLRKIYQSPKNSPGSFASRVVAGSAESINMPKEMENLTPRRQRPYSVDSPEIKESHQLPLLKISIPINTSNVPTFKDSRRDSSEAVAGSLPQSTPLSTPEPYHGLVDTARISGGESTLTTSSVNIMKLPYCVMGGLSPTSEQINSPESEEDRVCPMCEAVFPLPVPQEEFEKHVVSHFEVEEFELLDM